MEIRLMHKNDLEKVRNLLHKVLGKECNKSYQNTPSNFIIVADLDDEICGVATVYIHNELTGEKDYFISNLCVDPNYQRMGIATSLVNYIEAKGEEENIKYIYTLVPELCTTSKLYSKLNYELKNINCYRKEL